MDRVEFIDAFDFASVHYGGRVFEVYSAEIMFERTTSPYGDGNLDHHDYGLAPVDNFDLRASVADLWAKACVKRDLTE